MARSGSFGEVVPTVSGDPGQERGALGGRVGATAVAVMPFVSLVLFFLTMGDISNAWLFFLLIPATAVIVYGGAGKHEHGGHDRSRRDQERPDRRDHRR